MLLRIINRLYRLNIILPIAVFLMFGCSNDDGDNIRNIPVDLLYYIIDPETFDLNQVEIVGDTSNVEITNLTEERGLSSATLIRQQGDRVSFTLGSNEILLAERPISSNSFTTYNEVCEEVAIFNPSASTNNYVALGRFENSGQPILEIFNKSNASCQSLAVGEVGDLFGNSPVLTSGDQVLFFLSNTTNANRTLVSVDLSRQEVSGTVEMPVSSFATIRENQILTFQSEGSYTSYTLNLEEIETNSFSHYNLVVGFGTTLFTTQFVGNSMLMRQSTPQPFAIAFFPVVVDLSTDNLTLESDVSSNLLSEVMNQPVSNLSSVGNFITSLEDEIFIIPVTLFFSDSQTFGTGFFFADFNGNVLSSFLPNIQGEAREVFVR